MAKRILHILSTPRAEGTPNLVLDWLTAESDHWQAVVVLNSSPADLSDRLRAAANAYEEHDLFDCGHRKFAAIAKVAYAAVRKYQPDVLVCWPTGFANWVCLGAKLAGANQLLVHCGNPPNRGFKADWVTRYVMWPLTAFRAKCVCCSKYVQQEFQSVPMVPSQLFSNVWNCSRGREIAVLAEESRSQRADRQMKRAIMVATLEPHKDHRTLLQAVPSIAASIPSFELWLVGDGALRSEIECQIVSLGLANRVRLMGRRTDVGSLLGMSDLFVLSTTSQEGLGSALIEALAAGLPVVATDVPACREILNDGKFGTLVPAGNAAALADAVITALQVSATGDASGVEFALSLTPARMMQDYLSLCH